MDSNRNYKSSDDMISLKKDKTNDTRYIFSGERPNSRNSEYKKGGSMNGKQNGLPRSPFSTKSRSYEKRGGDYSSDGLCPPPSKTWNKNSNGSIPRKCNRRTSDLSSFIHEIEGDLFTASSECSLAHCVAEDFRMGAGIALQFK